MDAQTQDIARVTLRYRAILLFIQNTEEIRRAHRITHAAEKCMGRIEWGMPDYVSQQYIALLRAYI